VDLVARYLPDVRGVLFLKDYRGWAFPADTLPGIVVRLEYLADPSVPKTSILGSSSSGSQKYFGDAEEWLSLTIRWEFEVNSSLSMAYPRRRSDGRKLKIKLQSDKLSYKVQDATKRIDITLESWSLRITMDSKDFRCTPSRIKSAFRSRCAQLQLWFPYDSCKAEICDARTPRIINEYISLEYANECNINKERIDHTG